MPDMTMELPKVTMDDESNMTMDDKTFDECFGYLYVHIRFAKKITYYPRRTARHIVYLCSIPKKESLERLLVDRANESLPEGEKAKMGENSTLYEIPYGNGTDLSFNLAVMDDSIQLGLGVKKGRW